MRNEGDNYLQPLRDLVRKGYQSAANTIDREVAEQPCDKCREPRRYIGLRRGYSHKSFAVCDNCRILIDF